MKTARIVMVILVLGGGLYFLSTPPSVEVLERRHTDTPGAPASDVAHVEVYDGIRVPVHSPVLDLSGQGLTGSLKAEVRLLVDLKELDVSNNGFTGLPAETGQLTQLEVLNLSNNPITGLPHELGDLSNLKRLDLRGTTYATGDLEYIQSELPTSVEILID